MAFVPFERHLGAPISSRSTNPPSSKERSTNVGSSGAAILNDVADFSARGYVDAAFAMITPRLSAATYIGNAGMSYEVDFLQSAEAKKYVTQGYALVLSSAVLAKMKAFCDANPEVIRTGKQLADLVDSFDATFGREGLVSWHKFAEHEFGFIFSPKRAKTLYYATGPRSQAVYTNGGMRGGYMNHMWGLGQFLSSTYGDVYSFLVNRKLLVRLPMPASCFDQTFAQQLCATYLLAIINQPTIVRCGYRVSTDELYLIHNQGMGAYEKKRWNFAGMPPKVRAWLATRG